MAMSARVNRMNGRIIGEKRGGVMRRFSHDPQGNTIAAYDSSGNLTDTFVYWPYGEVRVRTGSSTIPYQYSGAWGSYTDSSGRNYNVARYLRKDHCRWMTVDPLWPEEFPYVYADGSPVTLDDPSGLCACKILKQKWFHNVFWCADKNSDHSQIIEKGPLLVNVRGKSRAEACGCEYPEPCSPPTGTKTITTTGRHVRSGPNGFVTKIDATHVCDGCMKDSEVGGLMEALIGEIPGGGTGLELLKMGLQGLGCNQSHTKYVVMKPGKNTCKKGKFPEFKFEITLRYQCYQCKQPPRQCPTPGLDRDEVGLGIPGASTGGARSRVH